MNAEGEREKRIVKAAETLVSSYGEPRDGRRIDTFRTGLYAALYEACRPVEPPRLTEQDMKDAPRCNLFDNIGHRACGEIVAKAITRLEWVEAELDRLRKETR